MKNLTLFLILFLSTFTLFCKKEETKIEDTMFINCMCKMPDKNIDNFPLVIYFHFPVETDADQCMSQLNLDHWAVTRSGESLVGVIDDSYNQTPNKFTIICGQSSSSAPYYIKLTVIDPVAGNYSVSVNMPDYQSIEFNKEVTQIGERSYGVPWCCGGTLQVFDSDPVTEIDLISL